MGKKVFCWTKWVLANRKDRLALPASVANNNNRKKKTTTQDPFYLEPSRNQLCSERHVIRLFLTGASYFKHCRIQAKRAYFDSKVCVNLYTHKAQALKPYYKVIKNRTTIPLDENVKIYGRVVKFQDKEGAKTNTIINYILTFRRFPIGLTSVCKRKRIF